MDAENERDRIACRNVSHHRTSAESQGGRALLTGAGLQRRHALPGRPMRIWCARRTPMRASAPSRRHGRAEMPGVLAVLTGADAQADGLRPIPHTPSALSEPARYSAREPRRLALPGVTPHAPLPADRARYVGEAVAMVVAETVPGDGRGRERRGRLRAVAPVTAAHARSRPSAPTLYDGFANVCLDGDVGDVAGTAAAFAHAAHVVRLKTWIQRVTGVPMEPRAALGAYDHGDRPLHAASPAAAAWCGRSAELAACSAYRTAPCG